MRPQSRLVGLPGVGDLAGEREVQHAAERVDVGAPVDGLAADLLGAMKSIVPTHPPGEVRPPSESAWLARPKSLR